MELIDIDKLKNYEDSEIFYYIPMNYSRYFKKLPEFDHKLDYYIDNKTKQLILTKEEIKDINKLIHQEQFKKKLNTLINE